MKLIHFQLWEALIYSAGLAHIWLGVLQSTQFCFVYLSHPRSLQILSPDLVFWPYVPFSSPATLNDVGSTLFIIFHVKEAFVFLALNGREIRYCLFVSTQSFRHRIGPSFSLIVRFGVKGSYQNQGYWLLNLERSMELFQQVALGIWDLWIGPVLHGFFTIPITRSSYSMSLLKLAIILQQNWNNWFYFNKSSIAGWHTQLN